MAIPTIIPFVRLREDKQLLLWSKKLIDDLQSQLSLQALTINAITGSSSTTTSLDPFLLMGG